MAVKASMLANRLALLAIKMTYQRPGKDASDHVNPSGRRRQSPALPLILYPERNFTTHHVRIESCGQPVQFPTRAITSLALEKPCLAPLTSWVER
jgi:hypothetical protein